MPNRSTIVPALALIVAATALAVGVDAQRGSARPAVPAAADEQAVADRLAADPDVAFAEPDYLRRPHACADCWQLQPRPGVDALAVHADGATGTGGVVAVVDGGVNIIPDLNG